MILTGSKIHEEYKKGSIVISDFNQSRLTTNSYDLTLGNQFIRYTEDVLDPKKENTHEVFYVQNGSKIVLSKGDFLLASSMEKIGSNHFVPIIHNKSSIARLGLFVHITADLIDIGSIGAVTFQLYATLPVTIYPGMLIGQVSFWKSDGEIELYQGKYQNSKGPVISKSFNDYL